MCLEEKNLKVFISGPMAGYKDYNKPAFVAAEKMLTTFGYSVFNPAWLNVDDTWTRDQLLDIDFTALKHCDYIYQLPGWSESVGACAEYKFACDYGIKIFTLSQTYLNDIASRLLSLLVSSDNKIECTVYDAFIFLLECGYIDKDKVLNDYFESIATKDNEKEAESDE